MTSDNGNATSGGAEPTADELVADYLRELENEAARLPWNVRQELMDDMRSHIEVARAETDQSVPDRVTVLRILASLGDPGEIVDAASEGESPRAAREQQDRVPPSNPYGAQGDSAYGNTAYGNAGYGNAGYGNPYFADPNYDEGPPYPLGAQEVWAQILLLIGGVFAGIGWFVGVVLLWTSRRWSTRDKLIGTLVIPGGIMGAFLVLGTSAGSRTCSGSSNGPTVCTGGSSISHWLGLLIAIVVFAAPFLTAIYLRRRASRVRPANWGMYPRRSGGGFGVGLAVLAGLVVMMLVGGVVAFSVGSDNSPTPATPSSVSASPVPAPVQGPLPVSGSR